MADGSTGFTYLKDNGLYAELFQLEAAAYLDPADR